MLEVGDGIARIYGLSNAMAGEMLEFAERRRSARCSTSKRARSARSSSATTSSIKEGDDGPRAPAQLLSRAGRRGDDRPRGRPAGPAARRQGRRSRRRTAGRSRSSAPGHRRAPAGQRAAADRHQGHRRDDPDRPRPARADHRRPQDRQDRHRHRHDHQPEGHGRHLRLRGRSGRRNRRSPASSRRSASTGRWTTRSSSPPAARDPAPLQYIAPYAGCAMAEYFMYEQGKATLCVYDDLSKQAAAYRAAVAAAAPPAGPRGVPRRRVLPPQPPAGAGVQAGRTATSSCPKTRRDGRHRRQGVNEQGLRGRAGQATRPQHDLKAHEPAGPRGRARSPTSGGSLTALPIIETLEGEVSAYIPTNVISITDGQIYLEPDLFFAGVRPADQRRHQRVARGRQGPDQGDEEGGRLAAARPGGLPRAGGVRPARHRARRGDAAAARPRPARWSSCSSSRSTSPMRRGRPGHQHLRGHAGLLRRRAAQPDLPSSRSDPAQARAATSTPRCARRSSRRGDLTDAIWRRSCSKSHRRLQEAVRGGQVRQAATAGSDDRAEDRSDGQSASDHQAAQGGREHPQDHADDAADRHRALPGGVQPGRRAAAVHRADHRAGAAAVAGRSATSTTRCCRPNTESKRSRLIVHHQQPRAVRRLQRSILRTGERTSTGREAAGETVDLHVVGKKGIAYFKAIRGSAVARLSSLLEEADALLAEGVELAAAARLAARRGARGRGAARWRCSRRTARGCWSRREHQAATVVGSSSAAGGCLRRARHRRGRSVKPTEAGHRFEGGLDPGAMAISCPGCCA